MAIQFTCSCGERLTANDTDAGMEVRCPRCGNSIIVPASAGVLGYVAPATGDPIVTPVAVDMIRQTTLWVRIMSILMFIGTGFMLLGGIVMAVLGLTAMNHRGGPEPFVGCIYIPLAVLYIIPAIFLWRYATHTKAFALTRHEQSLEAALQAQKSFWKFVAITALVVIGLYILMIPILILVAVAAH